MVHDDPTTTWSVFTKPWRVQSIGALGELVAGMGFDAVELPVRPGYQVTPDEVSAALPAAVRQLGRTGVTVASIASGADEATFAACAEAGVPFIRIMVPIGSAGYAATGAEIRRTLARLVERAGRHGVRVAIQPHYDDYIADSSELFALLRDFDPKAVAAIWDSAHDALARKRPEHGLELLWPWLGIVNLKSAYYGRLEHQTSPDGDPVWEPIFTDARSGMAEWARAIDYLTQHSFVGPICLTAEYTDESDLVAKVTRDLEYARGLRAAAQERLEVAR
ncbi:sugar phosphate isomerase/epimerase [Planctomonas sp. JC2975]|uniref:sugar phosphate isomerase/epimerase family protein n=1 Tax=Planctomonas sp. JC2975 TaxID=2729626 RepID=UPI00147493CA|nr:TIM barrel protein [Planctomonas sp. JC2975]NNC12870.1 sugar phosphate isomerase/epimerase [Planctomonas sp. JC2975]